MFLCLNLRVQDRLHAAGVEAVGLAEVDDGEAVRHLGLHVGDLREGRWMNTNIIS